MSKVMRQEELINVFKYIVKKCDMLINNADYEADVYTQDTIEDIAELCNHILDGNYGNLVEEQEEPVSEDLEEATDNALNNVLKSCLEMFRFGAEWQKEQSLKSADGEDLPEYDKEVIVLTQHYPLESSEFAVSFAHRPNPKGWDGKSLISGKIEHYTPKIYDNGGWNQPNVKWWLDIDLSKAIQSKKEIIK